MANEPRCDLLGQRSGMVIDEELRFAVFSPCQRVRISLVHKLFIQLALNLVMLDTYSLVEIDTR